MNLFKFLVNVGVIGGMAFYMVNVIDSIMDPSVHQLALCVSLPLIGIFSSIILKSK